MFEELVFEATAREDPFKYAYFSQVFSNDLYAKVLENIPSRKACTTLDSRAYKKYRRIYRLDESVSPFWIALNDTLKSDRVKEYIFGLLGIEREAYPRIAVVRDLPGYNIQPHSDADFKVCTVMFYLPSNALQKMLGTRLLSADGNNIKQMGFFPNTGLAFEVNDVSWHDRPATPPDSGIRDSLIICYFDTPTREFR